MLRYLERQVLHGCDHVLLPAERRSLEVLPKVTDRDGNIRTNLMSILFADPLLAPESERPFVWVLRVVEVAFQEDCEIRPEENVYLIWG